LGQLERYAALVVLLAGRVKIEIGDQDPAPMSGREVEQGGALNGVISDFHCPPVFKYQKCGLQRWIGINRGWIGLDTFRNMRRSGLFGRRYVRALPLPTPIKNGWATLVVSVVLSSGIIGLLLIGSISGIILRVRNRDCIPDGAVDARIVAMMMAVVVPVSLVSVVAIVTVVAIVDAVIRDESGTRDGCVAAWPHRCNA
jgi:hypothetical protein